MNTFKLRIVTVDHCLVKPNSIFDALYSDFSDRQTSLVPIIRIFGITGEGKKGCLHVHGFYPYLTIPFDAEKHINVSAYKKKLAEEFNKHLSSTNTNYFRTRSSKSYNYVYKIANVKAIPFYGYHSTERTFLRVFFYNPSSVEKARSLLESGKVMNTVIQPYEAHIPYILKFFIDYNLYGMNYINVKSVQFRYTENNVYNIEKSTTCEIEGDCVVFDILNREMTCLDGQNPGLKSMWDEERDRRRNQCLSSQITPQSSQERENNEINTKENNYLMLLRNILSNYESFSKDEDSPMCSPSNKSYTAEDFAEIFMNCIKSNEVSPKKRTFSHDEVIEAMNTLTQNETDIPSQCSQVSVASNTSKLSYHSTKDFSIHENSANNGKSTMCSPSNKSYTAEDFAEIFTNCVKSNEVSPKSRTFTHEEVMDTMNTLTQSETDIPSQCSQSSVTSNATNYSAKDFAEIFMNCVQDQANSSQKSCSSLASKASYSVDDFVKLMVKFVKDEYSMREKPIDSQNSKNSCEDVAETMMNCINLNGLSRVSEEDDDIQVTEEMSQLFTTIDKRTDIEKDDSGAQTSPLDLAASPASTITEKCLNYSGFDEVGDCVDRRKCEGRNRNSNEMVEVICDCNSNECCDLCCDRRSDLCDCEGGQCTKVPQIDGAFDTCDEFSKNRMKSDSLNQKNTSKQTLIVCEDVCGCVYSKRKAFSIPQLDGSSFEELSNKLRRPKRRPKMKCPPLPIEYWDPASISKDKSVKSDNKVASTSKQNEQPVCNGHITDNGRIVRRILGYDLKLPKSLNESTLKNMGRESVQIRKLTSNEISSFLKKSERNVFDATDRTLFYPTNLTGKQKLEYLLKLCKPLSVTVEGDDKHSEASYSSDDTLVNEDLDVIEPYSTNQQLKPDDERQSNKKLKYSIDDILHRSPKRTNDGNDFSNSSFKLDSQLNCKENEFDALTQINVVDDCFLDDDESTQDYWKPESPKKDETTSLKSSQSSDKRNVLNEDQENEVRSEINICSSQESNKSQRSIGQISTGELSDGVTSFYEFDTSLSSPIASTSKQNHIVKSPLTPKVLNYSFANSTQLATVKENTILFDKSNILSDVGVRMEKTMAQNYSNNSIIEGVNSQGYNFELSSIEENTDDFHEYQYVTVMSMELFTSVNGDLKPNPMNDAIRALFYGIHRDIPEDTGKTLSLGVIIVETDMTEFNSENSFDFNSVNKFRKHLLRSGFTKDDVVVTYAIDELDLYFKLIEIMKIYDPDIVIGYEIEMQSWGYLLQRANTLNIQISVALSRVMDEKYVNNSDEETIQMYGIKITGRIVLNLWRVLMHEITLNMYSYENVHFHVLHERVPLYTHRDLNNWFDDKLNCWRTINFYLIRVEGCLRMLDKLNLVEQYSELARVFGIQFYEVLSRGSQFRVESMMSRTAKAHNYIMVSPSVQQKVKMRAPEFVQLIMEPESNFYTDPVVVLDFQSLYPSIIIAYNYCYSTCLGRLEHFTQDLPFEFGCYSLYTSRNTLKQHLNNIHISPNAVAFLKPEVRRGVLPQMLTEILDTRVMVKTAMKANDIKDKPNKALKKLLNARQLGLKLIANVTYGYTGANFSGRMPCVEIADAIVSKGREALEKAIELVNTTEKWGGRVIYGDTDSLFILFRGCSKEEAFKRGQEIADTVTSMNPKPMKLKFEKVYMPCVLQAKKRYVGYSYETVDQKDPIFEAKGIETIRRDTCPVAAKILEKSLRILFTTLDTRQVKIYTQRQFQKILNGRLSNLQDFIFAREYRGSENYMPGSRVPSLEIAKRLRAADPRAEPRKHERVPYVVVCGSADQPLINLVRQPLELIKNPTLRLNTKYYIENIIIKTMNRNFNLIGIDVNHWYNDMPRKQEYQRWRFLYSKEKNLKPTTITQYFVSRHCPVCTRQINDRHKAAFASMDCDLCFECANNYQPSALAVTEEIRDLESKFGAIIKICQSCNGSNDIQQNCCSIDCPQLFRLAQTNMDFSTVPYLHSLLDALALRKSSLLF